MRSNLTRITTTDDENGPCYYEDEAGRVCDSAGRPLRNRADRTALVPA